MKKFAIISLLAAVGVYAGRKPIARRINRAVDNLSDEDRIALREARLVMQTIDVMVRKALSGKYAAFDISDDQTWDLLFDIEYDRLKQNI